MKKLNRIISAILILASLVSVFAVFALADDTADILPDDSTEEVPGETESGRPAADLSAIELLYNRDFEEGWEYTNGLSAMANHNSYIDYEETVTRKYNYFWRVEASSSAYQGSSGFGLTDSLRESGTVFEFKIKADDACDIGDILNITTHLDESINMLSIKGNTLYAFVSGDEDYKLADLTDEWLYIAIVLDWDATKVGADGSEVQVFRARVYYGDDEHYVDYEKEYVTAGDSGWKSFRFTVPKSSADREGMSYCIDDLRIYNRSKEVLDFSQIEEAYGSKIDHLAEPTIDIQDGPGKKSREQIISESLCMKVRVNTALIKNQKQNISLKYCAPEIVDGEVMVSLELLVKFMGYDDPYVHGPSYDITTGTSATYITIGRDNANVGGERVSLTRAPAYLNGLPVIAVKDISVLFPGWLANYDDMGLIVVYNGADVENDEPLLTREKDLSVMLEIMKSFVFDIVTKDKDGNDFEQIESSYTATGSAILADIKANAKQHPYLLTNQQTFDALSEAYKSADADAKKKAYLSQLVGEADDIIKEYAIPNSETGVYELIKEKTPVNVYGDGKSPDTSNKEDTTIADTSDGYDSLGTLEAIKDYSELLVKLAFSYHITGETKYADVAYAISIALGDWTHWGPADVANCAAAVGNFAVAYDWLYNYYMTKEDGAARVAKLAEILYNKGVKHGYNASFGEPCENPKTSGGGDVYNTLTTYVNVVSSANMIIGAIVLAEYDKYETVCGDLIGNNLQCLIANGLDQYAPDGSYAESAVTWADATNGFMKLIMAFESAAGTTYGFEDTWGIDKTFYYAYYIEDSDGFIWNYHEGGPDGVISGELLSVDTQMFNYAGKFLKDANLIAIRKSQLEKGKAVTVFDMLFYPETDVSISDLSLDYHMEGIHAFVSRSDWNEGAMYTGIMGGANNVYGGQLDSGNFIYRNLGIDWIIDLGSDKKDIYSYYGAYRYRHYRNNADGQNVIIVNTAQDIVPYGQLESGSGVITKTYSNEYGSYAVINNKSAYGSAVSFATRGLLVTNNRKTVVVQDEVSFPKFHELYWIVHTASHIYIPEGGKVAYLSETDADGNVITLRASIVSRGNFSFTSEKTDTGKLSNTYKKADYDTNGGIQPYSRTDISRLVISAKNILTFNLAVVFEIVENTSTTMPVGYSWTAISNWMPSENSNSVGGNVVNREAPVKENIVNEATNIEILVEDEEPYTKDIDKLYLHLANIAYILNSFPEETLDTDLLKQNHVVYKQYLNIYNQYQTKINTAITASSSLVQSLCGMP